MTFVLMVGESFLWSTLAGFCLPFLASLVFQRDRWTTIAPLLLALALVGACAGIAGGLSRAPVVGDIIPAFLGLLGAVAVYLFGVDTSRGVMASFGAAALAVSLLMGYSAGAERRNTSEDHRNIRMHCVRAYTNAELLRNEVAFQRFSSQMGNLCNKAMHWHISDEDD